MSPQYHSLDSGLCQFIFSDGRQCATPAVPGFKGFCRSHAALNRRRGPIDEDLSSELDQCFFGAESTLDVRRALERVFKAFASNRITARRAATFGYLGQLILVAKSRTEELSKRELHDLYTSMSDILRANYGPNKRRPSPAPSPASSSGLAPAPAHAPAPPPSHSANRTNHRRHN